MELQWRRKLRVSYNDCKYSYTTIRETNLTRTVLADSYSSVLKVYWNCLVHFEVDIEVGMM